METPMTQDPTPRTPYGPPREPADLVMTLRQIRMADAGVPVPARFRYDRAEPYVVTLLLTPARGAPVTWRLSRELLRSGVRVFSGIGVVRAWPSPGRGAEGLVRLRLGPSEAYALFEVDRAALRRWLDRTYALVPRETEARQVDWDELSSRLLSES
jgi:hypothetical protein